MKFFLDQCIDLTLNEASVINSQNIINIIFSLLKSTYFEGVFRLHLVFYYVFKFFRFIVIRKNCKFFFLTQKLS